MGDNLARILSETAQRRGDATAVELDDVELSYGLLEEGAKRVAGLLRAAAGAAGPPPARTVPTSRSSTTASCAPAALSCR